MIYLSLNKNCLHKSLMFCYNFLKEKYLNNSHILQKFFYKTYRTTVQLSAEVACWKVMGTQNFLILQISW